VTGVRAQVPARPPLVPSAIARGVGWGAGTAAVLVLASSAAALAWPEPFADLPWLGRLGALVGCAVGGLAATSRAGAGVLAHGGLTGLVLAALSLAVAGGAAGIPLDAVAWAAGLMLGGLAGVVGGMFAGPAGAAR
jgi:putative membrane protein (TIGR04086 family)